MPGFIMLLLRLRLALLYSSVPTYMYRWCLQLCLAAGWKKCAPPPGIIRKLRLPHCPL